MYATQRRRTHEVIQTGGDLGTYCCWLRIVYNICPGFSVGFWGLEACCGGVFDAAGDGDAVAVDGADGAAGEVDDNI